MNLGEIIEVASAKYMSATHALKGVNFNRDFARTAVNLGYHRIERASLWTFSEAEETLTSVPNQRVPSGMPTDFGKALIVYGSREGRELVYHDDRQAVLDQDVTGEPSHYSEWAGELRLWPTPTREREYLLRYYKTWPDLVQDSDTPVIPAAFHELLASYATRVLVLRTPPEGERFLPASAAEPFDIEWREGVQAMFQSPYTLKSLDRVPHHEFELMVAHGDGQFW